MYEHEASKARHSKLLALVFQSLEQLRAAHMALEAEYLQACGEEHLDPQLDASQGSPRTLNLCRELEAEIYHLGQRLEELQDHIDQTQAEPEPCGTDLQDSTPNIPFQPQPAHLPMPSGPVSPPDVQTYQEVLLCPISLVQSPSASYSLHVKFLHYIFRECVPYSRPRDTRWGCSGDRRWRR